MMITTRLTLTLFILFSIEGFAENIVRKISDEVKVEFSSDGLVNIYSVHQGKPNHHYKLKFNSIGYSENLIQFPLPKSLVVNKGVATYDWGNGIIEEWKLDKNSLQQIITINKIPALVKGDNNLIISHVHDSDLVRFCVGNSCSSVDMSDNPILNLRIDANTFAVTDDNCQQIRANKSFNYQDKVMEFSFDDSKTKYPITIKHTIKINHSYKSKVKAIAVDNNNLAVSYSNQIGVAIYEKVNNEWRYQHTIKSNYQDNYQNKFDMAYFGHSLAISGDTLVIAGDIIDENSECLDCVIETVNVYIKENNKWILQAQLFASSINESSHFGESIDLDGDTLVVGGDTTQNYYINDKNKKVLSKDIFGAVYVYKRTNNQWKEVSMLKPNGSPYETEFGRPVAIHGDTIVVGGSYTKIFDKTITINNKQKTRKQLIDYGQFTVFEKDGDTWKQNSLIKIHDIEKNPSEFNEYFASSIDIYGDTIVVGNPLELFYGMRGYNHIENYNDHLDKSGSVYVFKKRNNKWRKQAELKPSNSLQLDHFGSSVKIHDKTLIVGAYGESSDSSGINNAMDNCQSASSGAVYVFNHKWNGWKQSDYIKASNPSELDMFGQQIDYEGETLAVAASDSYLFLKKEVSEKATSEKEKQWQQVIKLNNLQE